ncbi:hypothetical protein F4776DRAFT_230993 [Hypoxylon sp. NC0597]|nr:hypothetical protein F4776DRAFT_230993 [Hypoxylon sp. NC0597]
MCNSGCRLFPLSIFLMFHYHSFSFDMLVTSCLLCRWSKATLKLKYKSPLLMLALEDSASRFFQCAEEPRSSLFFML